MLPSWLNTHNGDKDPRGRIWILWDLMHIKLTKLASSDQFIHARVIDLNSSKSFLLTIIYARNAKSGRLAQWEDLTAIGKHCNEAWILLGDFNTCREAGDKIGGSKLHPRDVKDLNDFMNDTELDELKAIGDFYSWSNRITGEGRILTRIDRCMVNLVWQSEHKNSYVEYAHQGVSDHCPIILHWNQAIQGRRSNRILSVEDSNHNLIIDNSLIEEEFLQYNLGLLGIENSEPFPMTSFQQLNFPVADEFLLKELDKSIDVEEVKGALFSIKDNKSP
ncbi:hypothetical protein FRX31_021182 [Thalictrum thalictroides]|uniref:Dnase i-like superfamily protein n=1 Tax=Thalictrum thalictroides TaxID=46969 RepID=A0A7J6VYH5_THATH|nr:hypothetical protein FRX31_021182 [Thalictrum thalictroides]